ncbi:hypothetical protein HPB52_013463 [Rhipicephalus sanguineus]|uniref:Uncharacterized protein n=1 Tax=Rhipicephalus sanguineus TaxID=34632 RepID=A0A9D4SP65_RHISA|nr:hypothetical protein HPB52_013463 [Rhipicephalus sanguineus]
MVRRNRQRLASHRKAGTSTDKQADVATQQKADVIISAKEEGAGDAKTEKADFEHVLRGCASAGPPFTQEEMKRLIKAQDQTSEILAVQRARARAVRFNLMVPEWA